MIIKVWIYLITGSNGKISIATQADEDGDLSFAVHDEGTGDRYKVEMKHYLVPAWCAERNVPCRVVVKEFEI